MGTPRRPHVEFDHLSIVSEESQRSPHDDRLHPPALDAKSKIPDSPLADLQSVMPPLKHFENIQYESVGPGNVGKRANQPNLLIKPPLTQPTTHKKRTKIEIQYSPPLLLLFIHTTHTHIMPRTEPHRTTTTHSASCSSHQHHSIPPHHSPPHNQFNSLSAAQNHQPASVDFN